MTDERHASASMTDARQNQTESRPVAYSESQIEEAVLAQMKAAKLAYTKRGRLICRTALSRKSLPSTSQSRLSSHRGHSARSQFYACDIYLECRFS